MHSPGPWHACRNAECRCKQVWTADHPVAEVISGPWGDKYPALKIEGGSLEMRAVPIIEMIDYGEVDEETARANARLIAAAPTLLATLKNLEVKTPEVLAAITLAEEGENEADRTGKEDSLRLLDALQENARSVANVHDGTDGGSASSVVAPV
jgi:hypothetical protein